MSICSYCYKSKITPKHDVSKWWNNSEELIFVCSDDCKDKLEDLLKDGKWMTHKPAAIFDREDPYEISPNFGTVPTKSKPKKSKPKKSKSKKSKEPKSVTDKQFTGDLNKFMT